LKEFWRFFDFRFNQKIRVRGYFNWGRTLPLIIERFFGNFGGWIKDCKIRVPILYIWEEIAIGEERCWGRLHFYIFCKSVKLVLENVGYNRPY